MNGLKNTVAVPKAGRYKYKGMLKKNKNRNSTLSLPASDVPAGAEPSLSCDLGMEDAQASTSPLEPTKSKKRNKSVIFADENEEIAPKKPKTDDAPVSKKHESRIFRNSQMKKPKKNKSKDQIADEHMVSTFGTSTSPPAVPKKLKRKAENPKPKNGSHGEEKLQATDEATCASIKRDDTNNNQTQKQKKYGPQKKQAIMDTKDEATVTMQRQLLSSSEEELNQVLGNMHIENNVFLSDAVDEMVPTAPIPCRPRSKYIPRQNSDDDSNEFDLNKVVQWTKNNWNKDRIDAMTVNEYNSSVVIENLPSIMTPVYKDKLMDLFEKYGHIINIGPVNMLPSDGDDMSTFNTTLCFDSEEAAINALDEDNAHMGGVPIRVRRPLPIVDPARSGHCRYSQPIGDLNVLFCGSGPVRAARLVPDRDSAAPFVKIDTLGEVPDGLVPAIIDIKG